MKKQLAYPKKIFKDTIDLFVAAGKGFAEDKIPKLSGALSYFTVFSIPPLLTIIIALASLIYKKEAIEGKLFADLNTFLGPKLASSIQEFVANASISGKSTIALVTGAVSLFIGATAIFTEIQDSINTIWEVKPIPKKGWQKLIQNRLLSFSLVISLGFLLLVSLIVSSMLSALKEQLQLFLPFISAIIITIASTLISIIIISFLFAVIFKVLPDVELKWKPALIGAGVTAVLFTIGKYLIDLYIQKSNPGVVFGTAGSVVLLLVWVYYTSFILYFGAEFTQAYAEKYSDGIKPSKYAVHTKVIIEKKDVNTLPAQHPEETKN